MADFSAPLDAVGPSGAKLITLSFTTSGTTSDVTINEAQGATVARTGVGLFEVTLNASYKAVTVAMSVQAASTAQLFKLDSRNLTTGKIVIRQVTAGGNTAVDTLAARIDLVIVGRVAS